MLHCKSCVSACLLAMAFAISAASAPSSIPMSPAPAPPAFPGAGGAGAGASGGRNGTLYRVTNLNTSGAGSLADAVSQPNRFIVFDVSGTIELTTIKNGVPASGKIKVEQDNITIAGQTAPGEGICIKGGALRVLSNNVIVRHVRCRRGFVYDDGLPPTDPITSQSDSGDSIAADPDATTSDVILDHISASWATDENFTMTKPNRTTGQYSIASEGLDYTNGRQTPPNHSEGGMWGTNAPDGRTTVHHMLYAHNRLRNPRTTAGGTPPPVNDMRNCVIYNCSEYSGHNGSEAVHLNVINNYLRDGPSSRPGIRGILWTAMSNLADRIYLEGNVIDGYPDRTADNWQAMAYEDQLDESIVRVDTPFDALFVETESAQDAFEDVLTNSGCTLPARDMVDLRIVNDARNGTGAVIDKEIDLPERDRWQTYFALDPPADSDNDGLPDYWEEQYGLDENNPADNFGDLDGDGYKNIEEYVNSSDADGSGAPVVFVHATVCRAFEAGLSVGEIAVTRNGDTAAALTVHYSVSGEATAGVDYDALAGAATIPPGAASVTIPVKPRGDAVADADEKVVVTLAPDAAYRIGCPGASLVAIVDGPPVANSAREWRQME